MDDLTTHQAIASLFSDFDLSDMHDGEPTEYRTLSIWLPAEYKEKYDLLQERSKNKFGKILKEVIKHSIDKVKIDRAG